MSSADGCAMAMTVSVSNKNALRILNFSFLCYRSVHWIDARRQSPARGRWDCRPGERHALGVVYLPRKNRGLAATLGVENGRLGKSGADAVVRARPPGRALALIVNSYAGQVTSQPANFSVSELRQHRVTGRVADIHGSIMILLNRAMIDWRPYGIGAIAIQVSGGDSQAGAGVPGTPARPENACAAV